MAEDGNEEAPDRLVDEGNEKAETLLSRIINAAPVHDRTMAGSAKDFRPVRQGPQAA